MDGPRSEGVMTEMKDMVDQNRRLKKINAGKSLE